MRIEDKIAKIHELLRELSDSKRMEVFSKYCTDCGDDNPKCQCWNDE